MDLVLKNTRLPGRGDALADIAISSGEIAAIAPNITTVGPTVDAGGTSYRLASIFLAFQ
jgi:dihydroorotase-like cyclic amidohydrolase